MKTSHPSFRVLVVLLFTGLATTTALAERPAHVTEARAWTKRMFTHALKGNDVDENPVDSAERFKYQRSKPLTTFPEIVLHEVALVRTEAEARDLDDISMEPLLTLSRERNPDLLEKLVNLIEMLDAETFELIRGAHGKLEPEHFFVHPLTLRLLKWLPEAGARTLLRPDVFLAQAAELFTKLLEKDSTSIVFKGTSWAVLDSAIALQNVILRRFGGPPGSGDHSLDRDALARAFTRLTLVIQSEILARIKPVFRNEALCALRLEEDGGAKR